MSIVKFLCNPSNCILKRFKAYKAYYYKKAKKMHFLLVKSTKKFFLNILILVLKDKKSLF